MKRFAWPECSIRRELIIRYFDWVNNFITVPVFAEHYGLSFNRAKSMLSIANAYYHKRLREQN